MILVDTNVILDVLHDEKGWADWSYRQLRNHAQTHGLIVNPIIYAELSLEFSSTQSLDSVLTDMGFKIEEVPKAALFQAGRAFLKYRRSGGSRVNVLPDFFIGAHAAVQGYRLLTRDERRYRTYFPTVRLIAPSGW